MKRLAIIAIAALALALAGTASAQPIWFEGATTYHVSHVRPSSLWLSGDGTLEVYHVHWSRWGSLREGQAGDLQQQNRQIAVGTGVAEYHGCLPFCFNAPRHSATVTIKLWDPAFCTSVDNAVRYFYNRVTLHTRRWTMISGTSPYDWAPNNDTWWCI